MTFGKKLEMLRRQRGFSQEDLAAKLNVSRQAVSKWELGTAMPDTKNVVQLSSVFGVSTDYLLKDEQKSEDASRHTAEGSSSVSAEAEYRRPLMRKIGWAAAGLGAAGILVMAILSSVCPAVIYDPPQGEVRAVVSTGFRAFLELHNIYWLFGLCCIFILFGILMHIFCKKAK